MEFPFNIKDILPSTVNLVSSDPRVNAFTIEDVGLDTKTDYTRQNWTHNYPCESDEENLEWQRRQKQLSVVVDELGIKSGRAQSLQVPITDAKRVLSSRQRMYIMRGQNKENKEIVIGMLKVSYKMLYLTDGSSGLSPKRVLCLLDFYIVEEEQRHGYGFQLFTSMLKVEKCSAGKLAYDVPSLKLLAFLKKYFGLEGQVAQSNNFIVFDEFFQTSAEQA